MEKHTGLFMLHKAIRAYNLCCKPVCGAAGLPQTALDILLFLANNPGLDTAHDIVVVRGIPANLVSLHVERLVRAGLVVRRAAPGDRRRVILQYTEKAQPIIAQGRAAQRAFLQRLFAGVDAEQQALFLHTMAQLDGALDEMLKG